MANTVEGPLVLENPAVLYNELWLRICLFLPCFRWTKFFRVSKNLKNDVMGWSKRKAKEMLMKRLYQNDLC